MLAEVITNWIGIALVILEMLVAAWVIKVYIHKKQRR
jgi:hypothetical protein